MKCEDVLLFLDEDPDRRIESADAEAVEAHIEACPECAEAREALLALRDRVADLPRSVEPRRDLWPEIEGRIAAAKVVRPGFGRRALLAAAASVLVVASVVTAYLVGRQQAQSAAIVVPVQQTLAEEVLQASFADIGIHDYQATRQQLLDVLEKRRDELSPATLDVVFTNLGLIDEAMDEIAEALGEDPGNELLMRQLVLTYRQQINLLERAAFLPREI
jgi:hypothetical protein